MADDFLTRGIAALRAGNKEEARRLLTEATLEAPDDERAWAWLYDVAESDEERLRYLIEFLRISPNDQDARQKYYDLTRRQRFLRSARSRPATAAKVEGRSRKGPGKPSLPLFWIILGALAGIMILGAAVVRIAPLIIGSRTSTVPAFGFPSLAAPSPLAASAAESASLPAPAPAFTPVSTPVPTYTASALGLAQGSSFVAQNKSGDKWEISVIKTGTADSLQASFSTAVESAAGRFAILYLQVTNRGPSTGAFSAGAFLEIQDASGRRFQESPAATFIIQVRDQIDLCVDMNPGATRTCVAVYDISTQSDYYRFVPSPSADPSTPPVLLTIP